MWKKRKRTFISLVFVTLLISGGCRQQTTYLYQQHSENNDAQTTLTFFGYKYETINVQAIENALHDYMDLQPDISISYEGIKGTQYYDILQKRIDTGHSDDIFMVDQATVLALNEDHILADLSDLSTIDHFSKLAKSQMLADGVVNYVPTSISAFGLYCNEDLLAAHNQHIPQNLDEFLAVCDYFSEQGITPIIANNDISLKTIVLAKGLFDVYQQEHPSLILDAMNRGEIDLAQQLQPGFELVQLMIDRRYIDPQATLETEKTKDDLLAFAKGETPFMLTGAWASPRLRDLDPAFTFSIHPYPILKDGSVMVINIDTRLSINANGEHVQEAKDFVEYLTQPDHMWKFVDSQSSFSPLNDSRTPKDTAVAAMTPYMSNGRTVLGSDDNLHYPIWNMSRECIEDMLAGESSDTIVSKLQKQLVTYREEGIYDEEN